MAFPYIFESTFEAGTNAEWTGETDAFSLLDFPHYTAIAQYSNPRPVLTHSGAYCMRTASSSNQNRYVHITNAIADNVTQWIAFDVLFSSGITGTANDDFMLYEAISSGQTAQAVVGGRYTQSTGNIVLGHGQTAITESLGTQVLERDTWYTVELKIALDTGGSGTTDLYVTKAGNPAASAVYSAQVTGLTQVAVTTHHFGMKDLATTTSGGVILYDNFIMDDARIYPQERYPTSKTLTTTGHTCMGGGRILAVRLLSGGTDNIVNVYDSDRAVSTDPTRQKCELKSTAADTVYTWDTPFDVTEGCYVAMSGTNPRVHLEMEPRYIGDSSLIRRARSIRPA